MVKSVSLFYFMSSQCFWTFSAYILECGSIGFVSVQTRALQLTWKCTEKLTFRTSHGLIYLISVNLINAFPNVCIHELSPLKKEEKKTCSVTCLHPVQWTLVRVHSKQSWAKKSPSSLYRKIMQCLHLDLQWRRHWTKRSQMGCRKTISAKQR